MYSSSLQAAFMDLKEFGKYLQHTSFDAALHHVRRLSLERILANESVQDPIPQNKQKQSSVKKTA
jgi:hypothetical protein